MLAAKEWPPSEVWGILEGCKKKKAFIFASLKLEIKQKEKESK